jgi:TPP-dependent pyruvate/acetoin dehydrogenase alpha subunit
MNPTEKFSPKDLLEVYRKALLINMVGERLKFLMTSGKLATVFHPPRGQEVVAAAMGVHLQPTDYLVTIYRGMHDQVAKGLPLRNLFAEYFARVTGTCKGKGGPMHITHPETGVMVTTGVVGSGMPIANGLALASQIRKDGRVTVTSFGDGASNIGAFHEALNMAALWKLPVIFLCQNNLWGELSRYEKTTPVARVADRAAAYGPNMKGVTVNGNDPEEMWTAMRDAVARARAGEGPTLLEAMTFRFWGHYFGDPSSYIPKEEMQEALANDPVPKTRAKVLESGAATEAELAEIEKEYTALIDDAVQFALDSPAPELAEIERDIYGEAK